MSADQSGRVLTGAANSVLTQMRLPGAWAERVIESRRAPRWHIAEGRTFGEDTFDTLWSRGLLREVRCRDGSIIFTASGRLLAMTPARTPSDKDSSVLCEFCGEAIVQEKDDPWFHDGTSEERCEGRDEFATPRKGSSTTTPKGDTR